MMIRLRLDHSVVIKFLHHVIDINNGNYIGPDDVKDLLLTESYNAKLIHDQTDVTIGIGRDVLFLEFETKNDLTEFILKWS